MTPASGRPAMCFAAALTLAAWGSAPAQPTTPTPTAAPAQQPTPAPTAAPIGDTMTAGETTRSAPLSYRRSGLVAAVRRARLGARMDAVVSALYAREGGRYQQGDRLVEFDCSVERAQLEEARIAFQLAKLNHKTTQRDLENREISQQQVELAALQSEAALAALNRMREHVKYCTIAAPFDARVIRVFAAEYEEVGAHKPVVEIAEDTTLQFHFLLPWAWLPWLSPGDGFDVHIAGRDYRARLERLAPEADSIDKSLAAVARILDADDKLVIGMSGIARFHPPGGPGKADTKLAR